MLCELYLLAQTCNPHAIATNNRIDITEFINLSLALSQCSITPCDRNALERIRMAINCENNEIERLYLEANPDAESIEIRAEREGDRFYLPLD